MNMKTKLCDSCNSPIIKVKKGTRVSMECSYCGKVSEKGAEISDFLPEYAGDDE
jgi:DNA-directed RNA polymerase subunit M/transcription elongation factor TFIIS